MFISYVFHFCLCPGREAGYWNLKQVRMKLQDWKDRVPELLKSNWNLIKLNVVSLGFSAAFITMEIGHLKCKQRQNVVLRLLFLKVKSAEQKIMGNLIIKGELLLRRQTCSLCFPAVTLISGAASYEHLPVVDYFLPSCHCVEFHFQPPTYPYWCGMGAGI